VAPGIEPRAKGLSIPPGENLQQERLHDMSVGLARGFAIELGDAVMPLGVYDVQYLGYQSAWWFRALHALISVGAIHLRGFTSASS
jgi:hypothetical protein